MAQLSPAVAIAMATSEWRQMPLLVVSFLGFVAEVAGAGTSSLALSNAAGPKKCIGMLMRMVFALPGELAGSRLF
jgi:hypothetical protein